MENPGDIKADIVSMLNDKQQVTYGELRSFAISMNVGEEALKKNLKELEGASAIASRSSGGILTYYILQNEPALRRIMVVEDDKNISKLMALTLGKNFDITQIYDGSEALQKIKYEKPDLVVLDLMLPGMDGLQICQTIKKTPTLSDTIVIIVSAMDATSNRFKGIKYGADYYIRKPFDPVELRSLVTIFLKKKGKKFDPLVDLPNEDKISDAVEKAVKETESEYEIGRLRVDGLAEFARRFGNESAVTILRLVSQLMQDKVREGGSKAFVGFLNGDDFVLAGDKEAVGKITSEIVSEFSAVLPFVYQSEGYKPIELGIDDMYGAESPKLELIYTPIEKDFLIERRKEVLKGKSTKTDIGSYTYDELRKMLGSEELDITITRTDDGVRLSIGKGGEEGK
ncbi:MAG: response regulator [Candidatus Micrarchaeota archaeon]|nr:response regulator [Candidatus Micrarchaeota archaeon]MDE1859242.1 response regulator [Candidatus Micrarchaeota archaeon]